MIESIVNAIQLAVACLCMLFCAYQSYRLKNRVWEILTFFYATMFLGDFYWFLYHLFYNDTPNYYVSDFSWDAAYLFIILLLRHVQSDEERSVRHPLLFAAPIIAIGMCIFFMQYGDYLGNIIVAFLFGMIIWRSLQGLLYKGASLKANKTLYLAALGFCFIEYILWTSSCFWVGDTIINAYFWIDMIFAIYIVLFIPAIRRAVAR